MRIVLFGPPGAGKGTQAVKIAADFAIPHISTGDMMRAAVAGASAIGQKVKKYLDAGELVPDDVVIEVIRERLTQADCARGFLLDGFPRTVPQAKKLDQLLSQSARPLTHVVNLVVPEAVLMERIRKRGESGSGRSDDNVEVAQKRLRVFLEQTAPVIAFYGESQRTSDVNGVGSVDEVYNRIKAVLGAGASGAKAQ